MVLAYIEVILTALHAAPMDGVNRTIVIASQTIGTTAVMLPVWWLFFYIVDRTFPST